MPPVILHFCTCTHKHTYTHTHSLTKQNTPRSSVIYSLRLPVQSSHSTSHSKTPSPPLPRTHHPLTPPLPMPSTNYPTHASLPNSHPPLRPHVRVCLIPTMDPLFPQQHPLPLPHPLTTQRPRHRWPGHISPKPTQLLTTAPLAILTQQQRQSTNLCLRPALPLDTATLPVILLYPLHHSLYHYQQQQLQKLQLMPLLTLPPPSPHTNTTHTPSMRTSSTLLSASPLCQASH